MVSILLNYRFPVFEEKKRQEIDQNTCNLWAYLIKMSKNFIIKNGNYIDRHPTK